MTSPKKTAPARHATRAPIDRPVRLQFDEDEGLVEGRSKNVSIGGMFVRQVGARERGTQVRFELLLDDETSIRGIAEVVWSQSAGAGGREEGLGLKFRFLEQRDRQQVFRLVSEHIKERLVREGPSASPPSSLFAPASTEENEDLALSTGIDVPPMAAGAPSAETSSTELETDEALFAETIPEPPAAEALQPVVPPESAEAEPDRGDRGSGGPEAWPASPLQSGPSRPGGSRSAWKVAVPLLVLLAAIVGYLLLRPGDGETPSGTVVDEELAPAPPAIDSPADSEAVTPETEPAESLPQAAADGAVSAPAGPASPEPSPPDPTPRSPTQPPATAESTAFSRLVDVRWRREGADLIVVLETDGRVDEGSFRYFRIGGANPREVVRLLGVNETFGKNVAPAPDVDAVSRVRFGYHPKPEGNELHVVLDLADPAWQLIEVVPRGNRLEGLLRR